jgi:uncharacterized LabA/DUF88 family protein
MLKGGVYLDVENLTRNGGWGMRFGVITDLVRAQEVQLLRANAYVAADFDREAEDPEYARRNKEFRNAIRRAGFHLLVKRVRRFVNDDGETILKANADLDLAVDALVQSENLDYILLGTGDGDFVRLVRALQNRGRRVDILSFAHTSNELRYEADFYFSGFLIPNLLETENGNQRCRGVLYSVSPDRGYGFARVRSGLQLQDVVYDVFCHINEFQDHITNEEFVGFKQREAVLEMDLIRQPDGRYKGERITEYTWGG